MTDDTPVVPPALTPEEWTHGPLRGGYVSFARGILDCRDSDFEEEFAPAIMALANASLPDDSPYKITAGDLFDLSEVIENFEAAYKTRGGDNPKMVAQYAPGAWRIYRALAAILPPGRR
jgi:hypothetical protein